MLTQVNKFILVYILIPAILSIVGFAFLYAKMPGVVSGEVTKKTAGITLENQKIKEQLDRVTKENSDLKNFNEKLIKDNTQLKSDLSIIKNKVDHLASTEKVNVDRDKEKITEKYGKDGKVVERVVEKDKIMISKDKKEEATSIASSSVIVNTSSSSSVIVSDTSSSSVSTGSVSVVKDKTDNSTVIESNKAFGVGPVAWVGLDGNIFGGLSYRIYEIPGVGVSLDAIAGVSPKVDLKTFYLAGGVMLSKEMSPRLNLGITGFGNINTMSATVGFGASYMF